MNINSQLLIFFRSIVLLERLRYVTNLMLCRLQAYLALVTSLYRQFEIQFHRNTWRVVLLILLQRPLHAS